MNEQDKRAFRDWIYSKQGEHLSIESGFLAGAKYARGQQEPFTWALEWWDKDGEYEVEYSTMGEFSFGRKGGFPLFRAAPAVAVNEQILEALKSVTKATDLTTYGMALNNARAAIRAAEAAKGGAA